MIGYDPMVNQGERIGNAEAVSFEELLKQSDAVSLHCPADGNQNLFDMEAFRVMKDSAVIVNAARGGIINEEDLDRADRKSVV